MDFMLEDKEENPMDYALSFSKNAIKNVVALSTSVPNCYFLNLFSLWRHI